MRTHTHICTSAHIYTPKIKLKAHGKENRVKERIGKLKDKSRDIINMIEEQQCKPVISALRRERWEEGGQAQGRLKVRLDFMVSPRPALQSGTLPQKIKNKAQTFC